MPTTNPVMQRAIEDCKECHLICVQTIQYSFQQGGSYAAPDFLRLLEDCAQLCQLSEDYMLRESPFSATTCTVCAQVCDQCAVACDQVGRGTDAQLRACADQCRRCAESCRQMAQLRP
ncbi:MAG TPA: four-helix bundle copper-binding protein [Ktedonobacteraceae bacterium]